MIPAMMCRFRVVDWIVAVSLFVACLQQADALDWEWRVGRATNYGGPGDPWTIHYGSCGYYYLDPTVNKGWDVAALPDAVSDYQGSCGRCYEIMCNPMHLTDGYGTGLDRSSVCYNAGQSVTVMITDSCPCNYAPNYYSNRRWCCGDYYHFDMSSWTFEKLADKKWGVIGIKYREVPCDHCPENPAQPPSDPSWATQDPPAGWQPSQDKRPYAKQCFKSSLDRNQGRSDSSSSSSASASATSSNDGGSAFVSATASSSSGGSSASASASSSSSQDGPLAGSLLGSWRDYSYSVRSTWTGNGPESKAYCGTLKGYGGLVFVSPSGGSINQKRQLSMAVQVDSNGRAPDMTITLASAEKGSCRGVNIRDLSGERKDDYIKLTIPLSNFSWSSGASWQSSPSDFSGCSSAIGVWDVDKIEFKNNWGGDQNVCVSNVQVIW